MGSAHSSTLTLRTGGSLDAFVAELGPDIVYDKSLGSSRFLKSVRCRHRHGYLVVKIYIKSDANSLDGKYERRLRKERKLLQDVPNVYSYQAFKETDKGGYMIRQWVASSLYDRISTRPFLSIIEKKWISFQILTGLRDARKRKVSHGDIKSENILVTSWNWVYITDFSSFKPTYLPLDNPTDFAFFYDTSGRRNCYIAPERFFSADKGIDASRHATANDDHNMSKGEPEKKDGRVTEAMDVFSAGCVLAELFLEGTALFTLSQLYKYREGDFDVDVHLAYIEDDLVRGLIRRMIALEPSERPSFDALLHQSRGNVFPESFYSSLHDFVLSVNDISSLNPFTVAAQSSGDVTPTTSSVPSKPSTVDEKTAYADRANNEQQDKSTPLPTDSDRRLHRIWSEFETIEPHLKSDSKDPTDSVTKVDYTLNQCTLKPMQTLLPVVVQLPNAAPQIVNTAEAPGEDGLALIVLSLVCANLRNCALPSSKLRSLDVLLVLSLYLTDEAKLDRLLPYVMELLHDDAPIVRASALRTALQILTLVNAINPFNADILPQYVFPYLRFVTRDSEQLIRSFMALSIAPFANLAVKFLEMSQALRAHGAFMNSEIAQYDEAQYEVSYDASMEELQKQIEEYVSTLLVDQSSDVKRSMLIDIAPLCIFFGRQKTNDTLLSHMITYLNDRNWLLRYAFFDSVVDAVACLGGRHLEEYIYPLMTQALSDAEETNVAKVLSSLTTLCELDLFHKIRLWELISFTLPLLYHPNMWIRQGACAFIVSTARQLPYTDVWCILYPSLKHYLRSDIREVNVRNILTSIKNPLSRNIYDFAFDWAMRAENSQFWKGPRKSISRTDSLKENAANMRKGTRASIRITPRSEEDDFQLQKLQQLGMNSSEEGKLISLRDHISKSANAVNSFRTRQKPSAEIEILQTVVTVELQKLGVVPHTIFLGSRLPQIEGVRRTSAGRQSISRVSSYDLPTAGPTNVPSAPFEDLRRRLATINGSSASVNSGAQEVRSPAIVSAPPSYPPSIQSPIVDFRPASPTESIVSTTNSSAFRPPSRFSVGSVEGQKAAPAVGSVKTNAMGVLEAPNKPHLEVVSDRQGWVSPATFASTASGGRHSLPPSVPEEGQENTISRLFEQLYIDSNKDAQDTFGPRVHEGPVRRKNLSRQSYASRDSRLRTPSVSLISHLNAHSESVNGLAVAPDHSFFVSCSDDKTVKIWDTARLERNVTSKPRHSYTQHHSRVRCICVLEGFHCFASAADDGSLHVVRVHVSQTTSLPKYGKLQVVREYKLQTPGEYITAMTHYNIDLDSIILYATNHSTVAVLDIRALKVLQKMENPKHLGPIVSLCVDRRRTWVVIATSTGALSLWDLRFGLLLRTWCAGGANEGRSVRLRQCLLHPSKGRWIMVAVDAAPQAVPDDVGKLLIEVWDIEKGILVECFVLRETSPENSVSEVQVSMNEPEKTSASALAALVQSHRGQPQQRQSSDVMISDALTRPDYSITAMFSGVDFGGQSGLLRSFVDLSMDGNAQPLGSAKTGFLLAGTEERKIVFWDLDKIYRSISLDEQDGDKERSTFSSVTLNDSLKVHTHIQPSLSSALSNASGGQRTTLMNSYQNSLFRTHQDLITSIVCVDSPFRGGIVTGDRAGVIKVWRVENDSQSSFRY